MQNCKKKQEEEVAALKKEVVGMTILKLNYEQIVSAHQNQPGNQSRQVSDDVKFEVVRLQFFVNCYYYSLFLNSAW